MKNMKFQVAELSDMIQGNRESHRKIFFEAQDGYRKAMIRELDRRLNEARSGQKISRAAWMAEPEDHTRDYDRILKMLGMCTETHVELDEKEFAQYVMDDWAWKRNFLVANSAYSATATAMMQEIDD